jgi:hypothetical protein
VLAEPCLRIAVDGAVTIVLDLDALLAAWQGHVPGADGSSDVVPHTPRHPLTGTEEAGVR